MSEIDDLAAHCIRCGFCLESCPTFVVTGKETESPRGRIYLIRSAEAGVLNWEDGVREHVDTCVGCRACETACPSGVEYGALLELARTKMESQKGHFGKKMLLQGITSPSLLRAQLALSKLLPGKRVPGLVSRLVSSEPPQANKPRVQELAGWPDLDEAALPDIKGEVGLLTGCAMKVLYPGVHEATRRLLRRVGFVAKDLDGCCGALHAHNGHLAEAVKMAEALLAPPRHPRVGTQHTQDSPSLQHSTLNTQDSPPLITNSAGCGSFLKEQGAQVQDISEFLFSHGLADKLAKAPGLDITATYHDACHLAHGQGIRLQPRVLLKAIPGLTLVELKEAEMCCGSGGIYNLTQPTLARKLLDRKWSNIEDSQADIVVTGNPGCHGWMAQAAEENGGTTRVLHTAELLEAAFTGSV